MCFYGHLHRSTLLAWVESFSWILESRHVPPTRWRLGCFILSLLGHTSYPLTLQGSIKKLASEVASTANSNRRVYYFASFQKCHTHIGGTLVRRSRVARGQVPLTVDSHPIYRVWLNADCVTVVLPAGSNLLLGSSCSSRGSCESVQRSWMRMLGSLTRLPVSAGLICLPDSTACRSKLCHIRR